MAQAARADARRATIHAARCCAVLRGAARCCAVLRRASRARGLGGGAGCCAVLKVQSAVDSKPNPPTTQQQALRPPLRHRPAVRVLAPSRCVAAAGWPCCRNRAGLEGGSVRERARQSRRDASRLRQALLVLQQGCAEPSQSTS